MKTAAISMGAESLEDRNETRDFIDRRITSLVLLVGMVPILVPNNLKKMETAQGSEGCLSSWLDAHRPEFVLLSGGKDIGVDESRDSTELEIIDFAYRRQVPLLGICRGMQMLAKWAGTGLKPIENHVGCSHAVKGQISGIRNSYHQFSLESCPQDFHVTAFSSDGEIEAIKHNYLNWEGWMWHPEREEQIEKSDVERIQELLLGA